MINKKQFLKMNEEKEENVIFIDDNEVMNNKTLNIKNYVEGFKSVCKYILN